VPAEHDTDVGVLDICRDEPQQPLCQLPHL
jgi:hypothetical protein